MVFNEFDFPIF